MGACVDGVPRGFGGGLLGEAVIVEVDEVVVVVEVVESEAEETYVGEGRGLGCQRRLRRQAWGNAGGPGRQGRVLVAGSCGQGG